MALITPWARLYQTGVVFTAGITRLINSFFLLPPAEHPWRVIGGESTTFLLKCRQVKM